MSKDVTFVWFLTQPPNGLCDRGYPFQPLARGENYNSILFIVDRGKI